MSRTHCFSLVSLAALAVALGGCSAITDFDKAKIAEAKKRDSGMDAAVIDEDEAGEEEVEGGEEEGGEEEGGCEPGTAGEACEPCEPGNYCEGGSRPKVECPSDQVDHDLNAATPCVLQRECIPGEFVSGDGSPTTDRACAPCASGRFSSASNSAVCGGWTSCLPNEYIVSTGSTGVDQQCAPCATGYYSDSPNSGQCVPYGECAAGTKRVVPTIAGPCSLCMAGEYCAGADAAPVTCAAGTWDHDSNPASPCAPWTGCGAGMYVSTTGSPTSNRMCGDCAPGTFTATPNATSCTPWATCAAGAFASVAGNNAHDRTCAPCAAGSFSTMTNVPACTAFRTCPAGQFVSTAGTALLDRVCSACPAGQFNTAANATACAAWTACPAGQFISTAGTASTNQSCMPCATGFYSAVPNTSMCVRVGECAQGTRQVTAATATANAVCAACTAGQYCPGGAAAPIACGNGDWDHDQNPVTACLGWTTCAAGTFVSVAGSATVNRACTACANGSFSTLPNQTACSTWTTCVAGRYVSAAGSATTNRTCADCGANTFTDVPNLANCSPYQNCGAGQYVTVTPSATTNRGCGNCPDAMGRQFSLGNNAPTCTAYTTCQPGSYVSATGTTSADRECRTCATGTYSMTTNAPQCLDGRACQPGTYQTSAAMGTVDAVCTSCGAGFYCPGGTLPRTACTQPTPGAPAGYWDDDQDSKTPCVAWRNCAQGEFVGTPAPSTTTNRTCGSCGTCPTCVAGYSTTANVASCTAYRTCSATEYQSTPGTPTADRVCSTLTNCPAGEYVGGMSPLGDRMCSQCGPGRYSTTANQSSCQLCAAGTASMDATRTSACPACPGGQFTAMTGQMTCTNRRDCAGLALGNPPPPYPDATQDNICVCASGSHTVTPGSGSTNPTCEACTAGTFSNTNGSAMCSNCPAGQSSPAGATSCNGCAAGSVSSAGGACSPCAAGTHSNAGGTACDQCTAGTASGAGSSMCSTCMAGQFSAAGSAMCGTCSAGQFSSAGAASCSNCSAGQFSAAGAATCSACSAGQSSSAGSGSCSDCTNNDYSTAGGACTSCGANAVAVMSHTACDCASSMFYGNPPGTACMMVTDCLPPNQYQLNAPTATTNRMCGNCTPGVTETTAPNQTMCSPVSMPPDPDAGM